jgi:hypothetical protein
LSYILPLTQEQLGRSDHQQGQIANDRYALRVSIGEEHFALDGLHDRIQSIDAQQERQEDAKSVKAVDDVVGEIASDP